jgi:hypothetical protein
VGWTTSWPSKIQKRNDCEKGAEEKRLSSAARFPARKLVPHLHAEGKKKKTTAQKLRERLTQLERIEKARSSPEGKSLCAPVRTSEVVLPAVELSIASQPA